MIRILRETAFTLLNVVQALFLAVWSMGWMGSAVIVRLLTGSPEKALAMARWGYSRPIIRAATARLVVDPLPEVDWTKPHVYVMNHQSMLDIVCAFAAIPVNLRFVCKHTLSYVPFLGWYIWATQMVPVNRTNRSQAVASLSKAAERVRRGANIIAFPEGKRSRAGEILPFKKGPFMLALEAGVPLIPIAIHGSGAVLPSDGFRLRPGTIRVRVGQPIPTAGRAADRDALIREARAAVVQMNREMGGPGGVAQDIANERPEVPVPGRAA